MRSLFELPQWILLAAMFALAAIVWPSAPEQVPIHWNLRGQVDGYGSKTVGLLLLPVVALAIYLLLRFLPRIDPRRTNYAAFSGAYAVVRFAVLAILAVIYGLTVLSIKGIPVDFNSAITLAMGALFLVIGAVLPRVRPNWFVGIRTPWTLSSDAVWTRTHRLGGWTFIALGLIGIALAIVQPSVALATTLALLLVAAVALMVYSYVVWRAG